MNTPEEQLSESLLAACKAAGIEKPRYVLQGASRSVYHSDHDPRMHNGRYNFENVVYINHPPYASDWKESLLEWVEPQGGMAIYRTPEEWANAHEGEPLADVLARNPESFTIETERNDEGEVTAHFIRNHHGDITEMIRPDHIADDSKMIPIGIEALVCADIAKRQQVGIAKYGTTLADNPLTLLEGLQHAYEESLDFPIYLKKIITDLAEKGVEKL